MTGIQGLRRKKNRANVKNVMQNKYREYNIQKLY